MHFSTIAATLLSVVGLASAATQTVMVGQGGLKFSPSNITAAVGDVVNFQFAAKNHTVTQSTFAAPCTPHPTSKVSSGFLNVTAGASFQWSITINNASAPLWFFCEQTTHCAQGMVFSINATPAKSFDAYLANALATANGTAPAAAAASSPAAAANAATTSPAAVAGNAESATAGNGALGKATSSISLLAILSVVGALMV